MVSDTDDYSLIQRAEGLDQSVLLLKQARLLAARLERLTPDSSWARRASGCRGTVVRLIDELESGISPTPPPASSRNPQLETMAALEHVLQQGFAILHAAAKENLKKVRGQV